MAAYFNQSISRFINLSSYSVLTNGIAVLVVLILLVMLIEKVLLDAYSGNPDEHKTLAFTVGIIPLAAVVVVLVFLRMAQILHI